jgi:hypothetical protein
MRKWLGVLAVLAIGASLLAEPAVAIEQDQMKSATVPGTDIELDYPAGWKPFKVPKSVAGLRSYLEEHPDMAAVFGLDSRPSDRVLREWLKAYVKTVVLVRADTNDGDNMIVSLLPREAEWWNELREWKEAGALSAQGTNAEVLSQTQTTVDGREAFTHIERDADGIYAYMEILRPGNKIMTIGIALDEESPEVAETIIGSVSNQ